jgi:hypothetical protein
MNRNKDFTQQSLHNTVRLHLKVLPPYAVTNNRFITDTLQQLFTPHTLNTPTPETVILADNLKIQQIQSERLPRISFIGTRTVRCHVMISGITRLVQADFWFTSKHEC